MITKSSHMISHEAKGEASASIIELWHTSQVTGPIACSARRSVGVYLQRDAQPGQRPAVMKRTGGLEHQDSRFLRDHDVRMMRKWQVPGHTSTTRLIRDLVLMCAMQDSPSGEKLL